MQLRHATPAIVLSLLAFPVLSSPDSTTDRYHFEIEMASVTDLSELGQGEMELTVHLAGDLSVAFAEDGGITIVLDTMTGSSEGQGQQVTEETLATMIGTTWTAVFDDKGRLSDLRADSASSQAATQLEGRLLERRLLRGMFPYIPPGASAGDTWADTVSYSSSTASGSRESTTYIEYTALGDTTYHGIEAMAVETASTATSTSYQDIQGGLDMDGTSTGTGLLYIGSDGKYLGGVRHVESEVEVSGPQIPAVIPLTANTTITLELLL